MATKCFTLLSAVGLMLLLTSSELKKYNGLPTPPGLVQIYGHRGARAYYPENTLEGYAKALTMGVSYLDADIVMSREGKLIVSHEITLDPIITRDRSGCFISPIDPPLMCSLTVEELKEYDVGQIKPGTRYAELFPKQQSMEAKIPTLEEMIDFVIAAVGEEVGFLIEIKSGPPIQEMAQTLATLLQQKNVTDRSEIQSFELDYLVALQEVDPTIKTAYLTDCGCPIDLDNMVQLGICVWGPYEMDVTKEHVDQAHARGLKVVPWCKPQLEGTAFNEPCIRQLIAWEVDGIITDAPLALRNLLLEQDR